MPVSTPNGATPSKIRDWLIYVGVGLAVVASIIIYANSTGNRGEFPTRWVGLVVNTALVFWILIKQRRALWHELSFWLTVLALLAVHSAAFTVVLLKAEEWPLVWFVPCAVVEVLVLSVTLERLFPPWRRMGVGAHRARRTGR
jgi:hypothetical protein